MPKSCCHDYQHYKIRWSTQGSIAIAWHSFPGQSRLYNLQRVSIANSSSRHCDKRGRGIHGRWHRHKLCCSNSGYKARGALDGPG
ncbi:hypothetical protein DUNSADRAFT_799 [Dunaliella salina]|uniref:Encoded protein n=1 Tax=Dunaliella salina TaxID=3046 RepID=A0ABQ7FYA9_DUNSA|nr:hypothetical protein DUNSADRAFT_799 [Dunaliella salina]|eukprot:KAF5827348.1 hypothetical protein DUNSADRAFT_799 [Dunaliella salina]